MKNNVISIALGIAFTMLSIHSFAQAGQKWASYGNTINTGEYFGTNNMAPIIFKTNSTTRLIIDESGNLTVEAFNTGQDGLVYAKSDGVLLKLPYTNSANDVFCGDGQFRDINNLSIQTGWKRNGMTIYTDSGYQVGIGTYTPSALFDVNGDAIIRGTLHVYDGIIIGETYMGGKAILDTIEASKMQTDEINSIIYKTNTINIDGNNSKITSTTGVIDFDNNMIVANNVTTNDLNVNGATQFTDLTVANHLQVGLSSIHLSSNVTTTGVDNRIYSTNGDLLIQSEAGSNYNTILNGENEGYVGIGTLSPEQNLHIKGITYENNLPPNDPTSAVIRIEDEYISVSTPQNNRTSYWDIAASAGSEGLFFKTDDGLGNTHLVMSLKETTGYVGIGITNPDEKLHVKNNNEYPVYIKAENNNGETYFGFNGAHGIIESNARLQLNYYSGQDVVVGGQNPGEGSFYSMHNTYLGYDDGQVAIGCHDFDPNATLTVKGKISTEDVEIKQLNFPDYVFAQDYKLMSFDELRNYININSHLPGVPSAEEISENGLSLSENSRIQMEKIEELTLYILQLEQRIKELESNNKSK